MKKITREQRRAAQTGRKRGTWKQGDPHPEMPNLWFWRYYAQSRGGLGKNYEYWVSAEQLEELGKKVRETNKKHNPAINTEVITKQCKRCGGSFETRKRRAAYCSDECRAEAKEEDARTNWARMPHRPGANLGLGLGEYGEEEI